MTRPFSRYQGWVAPASYDVWAVPEKVGRRKGAWPLAFSPHVLPSYLVRPSRMRPRAYVYVRRTSKSSPLIEKG